MTETSLSLLRRAGQPGDLPAWDELTAIYTPLLRQWLRNYEVQEADADDLVQDVFAAVVRDLPNFVHNQRTGAFRSWLRKILVHRLRHYWRSRDQRPQPTGGSSALERLNELADDASAASRLWEEEHDRQVVARLLERLRPQFLPKTWEAFQRQIFRQQRAEEVAAELGMPLGSVYVARSRVLSALRREAAGLVQSLDSTTDRG
jgi:RNA polymerase sigma factor (sigma-70 family)